MLRLMLMHLMANAMGQTLIELISKFEKHQKIN